MKVALDANRYVDLCRNVTEIVELVRCAEHVALPLVVIAELRAGFRLGSRSEENERSLHRLLQEPRVAILVPDLTTTHVYADLFSDLRRRGTPIPTNDLWIAALVIQHGFALATRDAHFERIPRVPRV